jgi:pimeloyl-ACP methyl ester carboxylesterase
VYTLAGYGYTVIAPDFSGFSYGQSPGYFSAPDEAYALLDATRAAANLLPTSIVPANPKVVIVGHSQGGHAALAAQALANQPTFGLKGDLVGVATFAPMYFSMASWEAVVTSSAQLLNYNTTNSAAQLLFGLEYMYSAGELYDGPGHGLDVVEADKRDAAKNVLYSTAACKDWGAMTTLGTYGVDYIDSTFSNEVGNCAVYGASMTATNPCASALAMTWVARWKKDRPPLDPAGAKTLIVFAGMDKLVVPGFAQCALDTIAASGATGVTQVCYDANADHTGLVRLDGDYVNKWIAHQADASQPDPGSCAAFPSNTCLTPPANL